MRDGFMEQVTALAERYTPLLAEQGVTCTVSKRYFQTEVPYRTTDSDIFGAIDHYLDKRRERRYQGYRNRYHCVILRFSPTEKGAVKKENCREYAFLLHKVERPHKGVAPEEKTYDEQKALAKIEKRLQKMLKKSQGQSADRRLQGYVVGCSVSLHSRRQIRL